MRTRVSLSRTVSHARRSARPFLARSPLTVPLAPGMDVEVVLPPPAAAPRLPAAEDASAPALFALYADRARMAPEAAALGAQILQEVAPIQ